MIRFIVAIGLLAIGAFQAFSQGTGIGSFEFMNVGVTNTPQNLGGVVYVGDVLGPVKASGTGYRIALYWGPEGTTDDSLLIQTGTAITFLDPPGEGQFNGGIRTITGLSGDGAVVALQARAWDFSTGATWEIAAANPNGQVGKGPIFEMALKDPNFPLDPLPRLGYAAGWQGFAITPVPEPSVWALAAVGVAALVVLRSRR